MLESNMVKSAFENFADKYVIKGKLGVIPFDFFEEKSSQLKDFMRSHGNITTRMIMLIIMENK